MSSFLSLPSELRNRVYELCLPHHELINPWATYNRLRLLTTGLLRTNKAIHREASSLLYAQNRFDFTRATAKDATSFLQKIGRHNAGCIRHIRVNFPAFQYLDPTDIALEDESIEFFANIQTGCTNLSTLTTSLDSTSALELRLDALDHPKIATEALKLANALFKAISCLQDITVEVYEDGPSDHIRRLMKGHGWTITSKEYIEEEGSDRGFSDSEEWDDIYNQYLLHRLLGLSGLPQQPGSAGLQFGV